MEQLLFLAVLIIGFLIGYILNQRKRLKNEQFESARLFEANDKLKATLVKKDLTIANYENYFDKLTQI